MAQVTYSQPKWEELDALGVVNNVTLASTTPIAYRSNDADVTAFEFCLQNNQSLISYVVGSAENPTVTYDVNQQRWEDDGSEPVFLQIQCDNGLNESVGEVNIANIGDIMLLLGIVIALLTVQVSLYVFGRN